MSTERNVDVPAQLADWARVVQHNADLADACYAQAAPLCLYLLDLREFYRWSHGLPLEQELAKPDLRAWIVARETEWDRLRQRAVADDATPDDGYRPLVPRLTGDAFASTALKEVMAEQGLVFGAGIGRFGRPQFFLADCVASFKRGGLEVTVCDREWARGASAPPAMSRDDGIIVRRDALVRWLWSRREEWRVHPRANGFAAAWAYHVERAGSALVAKVLASFAEAEVETLVLHELGERQIERVLSASWAKNWHAMLDDLADAEGGRPAESLVRAVRDLWADCAVTLPGLMEQGADASVHNWFGLFDGLRVKMSPTLLAAYQRYAEGDRAALTDALEAAAEHWLTWAERLPELWGSEGLAGMNALLESGEARF